MVIVREAAHCKEGIQEFLSYSMKQFLPNTANNLSMFLPIDNLLDNPTSTDKDYEGGDGIWNFVDYDSKEVVTDTWDNCNENEEDERRSNNVAEEAGDLHNYLLGLENGGHMCYLSRWFC